MFQAKDFYRLTGLKRSTIRFYQSRGILLPSRVEDNGYAYYDDKTLIDAMLIRNYRCVEFSVQELLEQKDFALESQITRLEEIKQTYQEQIEQLNRKIKILDAYTDAMKMYRGAGEVSEAHSAIEMSSFYIKNALLRYPTAAREEIEHCVNAFPFVHIAGRGELEELAENGVIHFEPGYEYRVDRGLFTPLHPELFDTETLTAGLVLRIKAGDPLCLSAEDLAPLTAEMSRRNIPLCGKIVTLTSAMEMTPDGMKYLLSARVSHSPL